MTAQSRRAKNVPGPTSKAYTIHGTKTKKRGAPPPQLPGSKPHLKKGAQPGRSRQATRKTRALIEREIDDAIRRRAPMEPIKE